MPKLYTDANPNTLAYVLEDGGSDYCNLPAQYTSMEAKYLAIIYGLNAYYLRWSKELDARQGTMNEEQFIATGEVEFEKTSSIAAHTRRELPPPVLVCCDNEVVVKQLSKEYHIANPSLRKLAQQVWQMCQNVDVKFQWVSRKDNLAGKVK